MISLPVHPVHPHSHAFDHTLGEPQNPEVLQQISSLRCKEVQELQSRLIEAGGDRGVAVQWVTDFLNGPGSEIIGKYH